MDIHKLCGWWRRVICLCTRVWAWGGSLKRQKVLKFKTLRPAWLRRVGPFVELEVNNSFLSNSSEWVPSLGFQDLEHLNRRKCWSSSQLLHELPHADRFWLQDGALEFCFCFCFWNLLLRFVCFVFVSIWGPHGKELQNSFLCELLLCPCKVLFFPQNIVSYIFIMPHHILFTVKILKGCFQVGQLMNF